MQPEFTDPFGRAPRPDNNLGIAGFVCSIVGILTGGLLSPVGLILSLFALRREPKGFAIAGVVVGAIGSCGIILAIALFFTVVVTVLTALGLGGLAVAIGGANIEAQIEMADIKKEVEIYKQRTGQLPVSLDLLPITDPNTLTDAWGNKYIYTLSDDGTSYEMHSIGKDKTDATADDIYPGSTFKPFDSSGTTTVSPPAPTSTGGSP